MAHVRWLIALALAACGSRPDQVAAPVGNKVLHQAPEESDCLTEVDGSEPPTESIAIARPDPSRAAAVCLIQMVESGTRTVRLRAITLEDGAWVETDAFESYLDERVEEEHETSWSGESSIELFAISPHESAIRWELVQRGDGPEYGVSDTTVALVRLADGGALAEIFQMTSHAATGEADRIEERTLSTLPTMTGGLYDLEVEVTLREADWALGDSDFREESTTETYRWDGTAYR